MSHVEVSNVYTDGDGAMNFIVMGGTLTYDFNHDDNIWPYNATGITIGDFESDAFDVNSTNPVRSITYKADEALVNFIVPSDSEHLTFDAMYQALGDDTYSYKSDADKEDKTLSILVPGVEVYYNVDDDTTLVDTNLAGETVSDLVTNNAVVFEIQYTDVVEPYDMVIRGRSINFSALSIGDTITLKYARLMTGGSIVDHVLADSDGIEALYTTDYIATDGAEYDIQWYYGNTVPETDPDDGDVDGAIDDGPLAGFGADSSVTRIAAASVYRVYRWSGYCLPQG